MKFNFIKTIITILTTIMIFHLLVLLKQSLQFFQNVLIKCDS